MAFKTILSVGKGDFIMEVDRFDNVLQLDFDIEAGDQYASFTLRKPDLIILRDYLNSMELD